MLHQIKTVLRRICVILGRLLSLLLFQIHWEGREHLPTAGQRPLIVIANHFSWFDAPLLSIHLEVAPAFLVATESLRNFWVRAFITVFDGIPIWRGQVDRGALRAALAALAGGKTVGIFPEGGMNPENADRIARGEQIPELRGNVSRRSATLVRGRSGSALLAVQSDAYILPVALLGTEKTLDNLRRLRRTPVTIRLGPVFGPLQMEAGLHGPARRAALDALTDGMMIHIAALFPPDKRGPYAQPPDELAKAHVPQVIRD